MVHRRHVYRSLCNKTSFESETYLGKGVPKQHSFEKFLLEIQRRLELKSVGDSAAMTVLVESQN